MCAGPTSETGDGAGSLSQSVHAAVVLDDGRALTAGSRRRPVQHSVLLTLLPLLSIADIRGMWGQPIPSAVLLPSQRDCLCVYEDAVVGLTAEVSEALHAAVVLAVGVEELDAHPLTGCEFDTAEEANKARLSVVNEHGLLERQLAEVNHAEPGRRARRGGGMEDEGQRDLC